MSHCFLMHRAQNISGHKEVTPISLANADYFLKSMPSTEQCPVTNKNAVTWMFIVLRASDCWQFSFKHEWWKKTFALPHLVCLLGANEPLVTAEMATLEWPDAYYHTRWEWEIHSLFVASRCRTRAIREGFVSSKRSLISWISNIFKWTFAQKWKCCLSSTPNTLEFFFFFFTGSK